MPNAPPLLDMQAVNQNSASYTCQNVKDSKMLEIMNSAGLISYTADIFAIDFSPMCENKYTLLVRG